MRRKRVGIISSIFSIKLIFLPLGNELGFSIPPLQTEAALGHFDAVLHVGDMAYDMAQDNARQVDHESL